MADQTVVPVSDPNPDNIEDPTMLLLSEGTPAVPAIPVAPVAPVAPEASEAVAYEPTGDVGLDMALEFVGKAGIGVDHPAMKAATVGDFSILRATLAAKGVQGWEQFVALGEASYAKVAKETEAKAAASRDAIFKEAGGEESWKLVQAWASTNASPEEKQQINALLNQGGLAAKSAVKYLVDSYSRASNVAINPQDPTAGAQRVQGPSNANAPLDSRAYAVEVQKLNNKLNGRLEGSKEYAALQARRQAFRG